MVNLLSATSFTDGVQHAVSVLLPPEALMISFRVESTFRKHNFQQLSCSCCGMFL